MPIESVQIRGDGVAAWCCALLLSKRGCAVSIDRPAERKRPWILVSDPVQRLLCDLADDRDLFRGAAQVRKRTVAWGRGSEPRTYEHSAALVAEQELLSRLWPTIPQSAGNADWTITASGLADGPGVMSFGSRRAFIAEVELNGAREECCIESFESGWLFLIAGREPTGSLIAVGAEPAELLESSRLIRDQIRAIAGVHGGVPAHPRILSPVFGDRWLACGTAAMTLDPLCGDGCGHSVREAILAAAVLHGGAEAAMLEHYQSRLRLAFERHLDLSRSYYSSGGPGAWWDRQTELLDQGLDWARAHAANRWRYRLMGFDLIPI